MAEFDEDRQQLTVKLVYYGPALSGKTTNLQRLHELISPGNRSEIMMFETRQDRTLFFDLLPIGLRAPSGLLLKFKLFTVPGQVEHDSTRKAVLSRADGVCFVADSQRNQSMNNAEAFRNLEENCYRVGLDFERLPLVIQFNKRDLPGIFTDEEVNQRWAQAPWPLVMAVAMEGPGVIESFSALLKDVYRANDERYQLSSKHGLSEQAMLDKVFSKQAATSKV